MRKIIPLIVLILLSAFFTKAQNISQADKSLTLQLINANKAAIGISSDQISNAIVYSSYEDVATGIRYVGFQQSFKDIPVYNQFLILSFRNGKLVSKAGSFDPAIERLVNVPSGLPSVTAESAVQSALSDRGFRASQMAIAINRKDDGHFVEFGNMGISSENITAKLTWVPNELAGNNNALLTNDNNLSKTYNLAWQVYIVPKTTSDYWMVRVDAVQNSILGMDNYTVYDNWGTPEFNPNVQKYPEFLYGRTQSNNNTQKNFFDFKKADDPSVVTTATYRVIAFPAEAPSFPGGAPALRTDPWLAATANAQTLKWNTGAAATDYNYTRGNNVFAYQDRANDNNGLPTDAATSTTALPNLTFDFVPNFTIDPTQTTPVPNQQFNTTNLFYWNNINHDVLYAYGFTEAGRNFQDDNLGRGGAGSDWVRAEAQDGGGTNNANFSTPADGSLPRMQMYLWSGAPQLDGDVDAGIILHEYGHGVSNRSNAGGVGCLGNAEQGGEGWSDYLGLMVTQNWATATLTTGFNSPRGVGTYALNQPPTGNGIRPQRYTTNFAINNATYATLPSQVIPHGVGWVWCSALWEMTWEIINSVGTIDPSIYNQTSTAGNVVALNLVMQGLRTQQCQPGFISARNAILNADTTLYGASHACAIWRAFARRGMGFGASEGSTNSITDGVVSFALPPACSSVVGPTVTINQAAAQADPTSVSPINFTVVFSEAVVGFATGDVSLGGTAGATTAVVTGGPTTFNVAVSGMTVTGTVTAVIAPGVCTNAALDPNQASTSTDNTVTFVITPPGVCTTFVGSVGPANTTVGLRAFRDGVLSTCAAPGTCTASTLTGSFNYVQHSWTNPLNAPQCVTVTYTNPTTNFSFVTAHNGAVVLSNFCTNWLGDPGSSALAGGNIVWSFTAPPLATIVFHVGNVTAGQTADYILEISAPTCVAANNPTVTINQAAAQPDPTSTSPINFTAVFNQPVVGFATGDVVLSGTAGATTAVVTGGPTTYNIAVAGMTASGTVIATIPAGVCTNATLEANLASTSTDNTVQYNVVIPPGCIQTVSYTGAAVPIPDNTPAGVDIPLTVAGVGVLSDLNFRFDAAAAGGCDATPGNVNAAVDHTFIGDLIFKLTSPSATTVTIVNRRGGTRENICTTLLDDDGGYPALSTVTSTSGQFLSGNFAPDNPLSAFDGQNANGVWTLNVSDNAGVDIGSLRGFSLIFTNVIPTMPQRANDTVCAGATAGPYNFTSTPAGATFTWTNTNTAIGLGASGTGNIPAFTATNATTAPITGTITVTPTIGTCPGTPMSFNIRVLPTGQVNAVPNQVVCRGLPTAPVNFTSTVPGTIFTWTNNNTSIGLAAAGNGNIPSFIAQNPTGVAQVATITVTPQYGSGGLPVVQNFTYTGAVQTWVVPAGVFSVNIKSWGAQGNTSALGVAGGLGGYAEGTLAVTPGQTLYVNVGGGGTASVNGGFNGGGAAGANAGCATAQGGGGGGASDVRVAANTLGARAIVAAGGGGAGGNRVAGCGRGAGGGGGAGYYGGGGGAGWPGVPGGQGPVPTGGTQSAGGAGGVTTFTPGPTNGFPGALGIGGAGGTELGSAQGGSATAEPGGVGGGLIGASGGYNQVNNWCGQSGAGGSSYIGGVTAGVTTQGLRTGNGQVEFTYAAVGVSCAGTPRTFTITVNPNQDLIIVADPGTTICEGDPTLLTVYNAGASTGPGTLYTQGTTPVNGSPSQVFEPANAAFDSQSADDFTVPASTTWSITNVTTAGIGAGVPTSVNVFFYANTASNLPGAAIASYNNLTTFAQTGGNYNVTLPAALNLGAGTYWVSFQVNMSFAAGGQWFWGNFGAANIGNEYVFQNPGGGFATPCTSWGYAGTGCNVGGGPANRNSIFSLVGSSVTVGTIATGTFLWSPAAGLSSTTSNPVAASPMNTTTYTVVRTTGAGCQASAQITINVNKRPVITAHPVNQVACGNTTATFTAAGTGTGLTYQWQESVAGCAGPWVNLSNTAPYSGVNGPVLTINPVTPILSGRGYRLVLSGTCTPFIPATNVSNCAILTVNPAPNVAITPTGPVCGGVACMFGTMLSVGSAPPPVPGQVTVSSGTINLAVPDGDAVGVTTPITIAGIPANATITNISVTLNMPHTYPHDMIIGLKGPSGQILSLYKHNTNTTVFPPASIPTAGWFNAVVSKTASTVFSTVPDPFRYGITAPAGPYKADALNGTTSTGYTIQDQTGFVTNATNFDALYTTAASMNAAWTLGLCDGGAGDLGTLTSWSIKIDYTTPGTGGGPTLTYVWSPQTGLYTDAAACVPYTGTNTPVVYAAPTVLTVYTVTATDVATGCINTASVTVNYTPPPPTVTPNPVTMCLGDAAVKLKSSSSQTFTNTFNSGTVNVNIPDGPTIPPVPTTYPASTSNITVAGIPAGATITGVRARFNITHVYVGDLVMALKAPNGQIINLDAMLNKTNNPGANFTNTVISSTGSTLLSAGTAPFTNTYVADLAGATFTAFGFTFPGGPVGYVPTATTWAPLTPTSASANGVWSIGIYDAGAPDGGTLNNWSLDIDYTVGVVATAAVWTPAAGLFSDASAGTPYIAGTAVDSVWARPTPAGVYNYDVTVRNIVGTNGTITTPMAGGNGNFLVAFNVKNNNLNAVTFSSISSNVFTSGTNVTSRVFFKPGAIAGNPGPISAANGWTQFGTATVPAVTANTLNLLISGMTLSIPAGATYGIALDMSDPTATVFPAYTNGTGTLQTYSNAGVDLITDGNVGWGGPAAPGTPANNPRNFNGAITFVGAAPGTCVSPPRRVVVTVNQPTTVTTQPVAQTICTDKVATFTVVAAGTGPFAYQWQVSTTGAAGPFTNIANGGVYSGATTATLTITAPPTTMNGYFYRVVINGAAPCAAATSNAVRLTVNPLPVIVITASPTTSLFPGMTTTLTSTVTPNAASIYTWLRNGITVPGATTGTLNVDIDGLGAYQLRVQDVNGCTNVSNIINITDSASAKCFIYPNPTSGMFQVRYHSVANNILPRTLTVYDAKGDRVFTQMYTIGRPYDRMDVDMRAYGKGLYWVEIGDRNGNRLTMCRVVIQ